MRRDEGEAIHPLFRAAMAVQREEFVYHEVIHLGGPRPLVAPRAQAMVAVRCAELVVPLIDGGVARRRARNRLDALLRRLGERDAELPVGRETPDDEPEGPTAEAIVDVSQSSVAHAIQRSRNTPRTARATVSLTARLLLARNAVPRPSRLLAQLDAWILRGELESIAGRRWSPLLGRVSEVLYRGGELPARPQVWLMRLDGRGLALLARLGGRLSVIEGDEGDVLASVPDAHFAACAAASGRPREERR